MGLVDVESVKKKRLCFFISFLVLLAVEVLIALYVHDRFIRPYIGDLLVVIVLYFLIRTIWVNGLRLLPLWLFIFAAGVEVLQYFRVVELLGLGDIPFFRILIGSVFDLKDILCYAVGCILLAVGEYLARRSTKKEVHHDCNS